MGTLYYAKAVTQFISAFGAVIGCLLGAVGAGYFGRRPGVPWA